MPGGGVMSTSLVVLVAVYQMHIVDGKTNGWNLNYFEEYSIMLIMKA